MRQGDFELARLTPASPDHARDSSNPTVEFSLVIHQSMKIPSLTILAFLLCLALPAKSELNVPGFTTYVELDPHTGQPVSSSPLLNIFWDGEIKTAGQLDCSVSLYLPAGTTAKLRLTVAGKSLEATATGAGDSTTVSFGSVDISSPGYQRFTLESLDNTNVQRDDIQNLVLDGSATAGAHFNLKPRTNAASVHLAYPTDYTNIIGFYCEVTGVEDPIWTYYMACGWHRGYFGMQVNGPTERRIIFSVWDSGNEAVDRSKVAAENRTTLVAKGEDVNAGDFGNEGTGGHSDLKYHWQTGQKQRFFVTARPVDTNFTIYSGYFFRPDENKWMLISSWKAPNDGAYLHGLYSFNEDFAGDNGYLRRKALFGNQWLLTADGQWHEQTVATFSHDGTGRFDRLDRFMGLEDGQFFLSNGGFIPGFTKFGEKFTRPATGQPPTDIPQSLLP
jgi:hypothetical protein